MVNLNYVREEFFFGVSSAKKMLSTLSVTMSKVFHFIREELFFGISSSLMKKMLWTFLAVFLTFFQGAPGVVIALVLTGVYFNKGGKIESLEFVKLYLGFTLIPIFSISLIVIVFSLAQ